MTEPIQMAAAVIFFILGATMGSFYNVLVDRLPNDQDVVRGRSECSYCHTQLKWYDLVPLLSFISLGGKCRYCKEKLSYQYMISELMSGGLFLLAYIFWGSYGDYFRMLSMIMLWSMLLVVGFMDYKYKIVIDQVLLGFAVPGVVLTLLAGTNWKTVVYGGLAGLAFYGLIYVLARLVFRKEGFGMGDVLLMTAIGVFLGPKEALATGFLSFYCCIIFIFIIKIRDRKLEKELEIPFAPSMCITAFFVSLYSEEIISFFMNILGYR